MFEGVFLVGFWACWSWVGVVVKVGSWVGVCVEMCANTGGSKLVNRSNLITNWVKPLLYNQLGITFTL